MSSEMGGSEAPRRRAPRPATIRGRRPAGAGRRILTLFLASILTLGAGSCATNPATGESQLALISRDQEIQMGRQGAQQVRQMIGLYDDQELQRYVERVGDALARTSERPELPWEFGVVEDATVNAFALPGGFIYLTRGILTYFNSEAEMAAVLGHEIGHVTARHSVEQMSQQQLFGGLLGLGSVLFEPVRDVRGILGAGLSLLFLKYSRDDERQADLLGLRYSARANYDPREAIDVFEMLQRQSEAQGGGGLPGWLSTHPAPEDRIEQLRSVLDTLSEARRQGTVEREAYLRRLDGVVYGENPRNGYFEGSLYLHPDLRFRIHFPEGWATQNMAQAVVAQSQGQDAIMQLGLAEQQGHRAAAQSFFGEEGIRSSRVTSESVNGLPATIGYFQAQTQQGVLEGIAAFIDHGGRTYQILGYAPRGRYGSYDDVIRRSIGSFDRLTDPSALNVEPMRIDIISTGGTTSIAELARQRGAPIPAEDLALLNGVRSNEALEAGRTLKWVVGEPRTGSGN